MRHIILEGPDGAGKTTLARQLCAELDMDYHHEGPPPAERSALEHYGGIFAGAKRPTVFDRFFLGETVYGPLLRGGSSLDPQDLTLLGRLMWGSGTLTIFCDPGSDVCFANNKLKAELINDEALLVRAYEAWQATWELAGPYGPRATYNYSSEHCRHFSQFIGQWRYEHRALPDGVIGSPYAETLFVGEQCNGHFELPFFGRERSSGYLNDRIKDAGFVEGKIALTNALKVNCEWRDLRQVVARLSELKTVVLLGKQAAQSVKNNPLPFVKVFELPHPQYWRRFHAQQTHTYVGMLKEALCSTIPGSKP